MRAARLCVCLWLVACGRLGFEAPRAFDADAADDVPPAAGFIVSQTKLTPSTGFSYVALDVDWTRQLAYVGTREPGRCVAVVDFSDERSPQIIQRLDAGRTTCLGVALVQNGAQLIVLSYGASEVALFDLGADPRLGGYVARDTAVVSGPRHFAIDPVGVSSRVLVVSQSPAVTGLALVGDTLDPIPGGTWGGTCAQSYQAVTAFGTSQRKVALGCQADHAPVEIVDDTYSLTGTIVNDSPIAGDSGFWSATTTSDGRALVLGWVGTLLAPDGSVLAKWNNDGGYRDVTMVGPDTAWTAKDTGTVEVLSLAAAGVPRVVGEATLGVTGEAYGIRVSPDGTRGIVITNGGYLVVIDPRAIEPADFTWPAN